jgi:hypothetical protein
MYDILPSVEEASGILSSKYMATTITVINFRRKLAFSC